MISISGLAHAASAPQAPGQIRPSPRALAPIAAGNTPATVAGGLLVLLRSASGPLVRFPRMPLWCSTLGPNVALPTVGRPSSNR